MKKFLFREWCGFKIVWLLGLLLLFVVGIIVGSFCDESISKALYQPSSGFGMFFESFGEGIGYMMVPCGGTLLFLGLYKNKNVYLRILAYVLLFASLLPATYIYGHSLDKDAEEYGLLTNKYLAYGFSFFFMALSAVLTYLFTNKNNTRNLILIGSIILVSMILQLLLVNFLFKYLACRPRYRFLMGDANDKSGLTENFRAWWEFRPFSKRGTDYYKSWPSGHTSTATIAILLGLLPLVSKKRFKYDSTVFFSIGCLYVLIVALARIVAGAHFLSDVSFGGLISLSACSFSLFFAERIRQKLSFSITNNDE